MARKSQETELSDYLLGKLSDPEAEKFEQKYFADDDTFEQILTAEDDVIDEYVSGRLSAGERDRVERVFLTSPQGRERMLFARSFAAAINDTQNTAKVEEIHDRPPRNLFAAFWKYSWASRVALTAACLVIVAGVAFLLVERAKTRAELDELRAERVRLDQKLREMERVVSLPKPEATIQPQPGAEGSQPVSKPVEVAGQPKKQNETVASLLRQPVDRGIDSPSRDDETFELQAGLTRGGGITTLRVRRRANVVFLRLNLETEPTHDSYRAVIETAEGRKISQIDSQRSGQSAVKLSVSAKALSPGDYILVLSGKKTDGSYEGVANYSFRIVKP